MPLDCGESHRKQSVLCLSPHWESQDWKTNRKPGKRQVQYPGLWSVEESYLAHTGTYSEHKVLHQSLGISNGVLLQSQHWVTKGRRIASSRTTQAAKNAVSKELIRKTTTGIIFTFIQSLSKLFWRAPRYYAMLATSLEHNEIEQALIPIALQRKDYGCVTRWVRELLEGG